MLTIYSRSKWSLFMSYYSSRLPPDDTICDLAGSGVQIVGHIMHNIYLPTVAPSETDATFISRLYEPWRWGRLHIQRKGVERGSEPQHRTTRHSIGIEEVW